MNSILINFLLTIIGSASSVASLIVALFSARQKDEAMSKHADRESRIVTGDVEKTDKIDQKDLKATKPWRWPFVLILSMTLVSLVFLLYNYISKPSDRVGWGLLVTFGVSLVSLLIYAIKAYYSFEDYYVLPPRKLWQVLYNKIPSHIEKANQLVFKFLVLKMEDSREVEEAGNRIKRNYEEREDFQVDVKSYQRGEGGPLVPSDYCGVIFIIGEQCYYRQNEVLKLMDECSRQLDLPIAYIQVGVNHYRIRQYHRISESYLDKNCANHLIMRSYRRSEHWIKLSRYSYYSLLFVLGVAMLLSFLLIRSERKAVRQQIEITNNYSVISNLTDSLKLKDRKIMELGGDRRKIHLANGYKTILEGVDIEGLRNDKAFKRFNDNLSAFVFGEVSLPQVLLWLRNDSIDDLICVYDSKMDASANQPKGGDSMIGGIANNKGTFVLWPGRNNTDSIWYQRDCCLAWENKDEAPFAVSELKRVNNLNESLELALSDDAPDRIVLTWKVDNKKSQSENSIALYGYSFDGLLAIELDFEEDKLNKNEDLRVYIQNFQFRNTVRKYLACVTYYIDSQAR